MVPDLFSVEEKEQICGLIQNASKAAGYGVTRCVFYFIIRNIILWSFSAYIS
jgi:hypothetical protein